MTQRRQASAQARSCPVRLASRGTDKKSAASSARRWTAPSHAAAHRAHASLRSEAVLSHHSDWRATNAMWASPAVMQSRSNGARDSRSFRSAVASNTERVVVQIEVQERHWTEQLSTPGWRSRTAVGALLEFRASIRMYPSWSGVRHSPTAPDVPGWLTCVVCITPALVAARTMERIFARVTRRLHYTMVSARRTSSVERGWAGAMPSPSSGFRCDGLAMH